MNGDEPAVRPMERTYRRVAIVWIAIAIIVAIGAAVFCILVADWIADSAGGPDATLFVA